MRASSTLSLKVRKDNQNARKDPKDMDAAKLELIKLSEQHARLRHRIKGTRRGQRSTQDTLEKQEVDELLAQSERQLSLIATLISNENKLNQKAQTADSSKNEKSNRNGPIEIAKENNTSAKPLRKSREAGSQTDLISSSKSRLNQVNGGSSASLKISPETENRSLETEQKHDVKATSVAKTKRRPPQTWFIPLSGAAAVPIDPSYGTQLQPVQLRDVYSPLRAVETPLSTRSYRSARSSSGSPSSRSRSRSPSPSRNKSVSVVQQETARKESARLRGLPSVAKVERIAQLWNSPSRSVSARNKSVSMAMPSSPSQPSRRVTSAQNQLDVLCEVCVTVRQLERAVTNERNARQRNESRIDNQREQINVLTGELINTQQRLATLCSNLDVFHHAVAAKIGPLPSIQPYEMEFNDSRLRIDRDVRYDAPLQSHSYVAPQQCDKETLSSSVSVLKEVDRLKKQYDDIQYRLSSVLQRSAMTLRMHGAASPSRFSEQAAASELAPTPAPTPAPASASASAPTPAPVTVAAAEQK